MTGRSITHSWFYPVVTIVLLITLLGTLFPPQDAFANSARCTHWG